MLKREAKYEIPSISNLVTTTALNVVKNKILNVSNLVKKKLTITKISKTEIKITADYDYDEYIAIQKFKKLILLRDEHKQI